jgi:ABC-2 type transport system ATP-binding protein
MLVLSGAEGAEKMGTGNAVEAVGLTRRFGDFTAVDAINFKIPRGEIFGLLGPNGAGKTTTIRMLCGILRPSAGAARVLGFDVSREPDEIKRRIGYMSQRFSLYNDLTAYENLAFYARIYGVPERGLKSRLGELIRLSGLEGYEGELTQNLSGAWRQRLALACAIAHEPPMLFLDEPTAGVDPVSRREFWDLIYEMAGRGVSVLATTHYMDEAEYCNIIGMMYRGQLVALDDPDTLKRDLPGQLIEIECDQPGRGADLAAEIPGVLEATTHGVLLHLTCDEAGEDDNGVVMRVREAFAEAGIIIERMERVSPSLEDVFITMVDAQHREQARADLAQSETSEVSGEPPVRTTSEV